MAGSLDSPTSLGGITDEGAAAEVDAILERSPRALPRLDDDDYWDAPTAGTTPARRAFGLKGAVAGAVEEPQPPLPPPEECPNLLAGTRLDKVIRLAPHRWVKIGRNPKSTLVLTNTGVSRDHCSVRWDPYVRKVELKLEMDSTTLVNGLEVHGSRVELQHADRIRIVGKGQLFDFVVDKRPVIAAVADPVEAAEEEERLRTQPKHLRVLLQKKLVRVEKEIRELDANISKAELNFAEVQLRRSEREQNQVAMEDKYKFYIEDSVRLERYLDKSREDWHLKVKDEAKANAVNLKPIVDATSELQEKIEKLQLKKDEMAREFHPHQYAVADVAMMELQSPAASSEMHTGTNKGGDTEGEDDAFEGLPNLKEQTPQGKRGADALAAPASVASAAATVTPAGSSAAATPALSSGASAPFGEGEGGGGGDGGDAKRARTEGGGGGGEGAAAADADADADADAELQGTVLD